MMKRIFSLCLIIAAALIMPTQVRASAASAVGVNEVDAELIARAVATSYPEAEFGAKVGICAVILNRIGTYGYPDTAAGVIRAADSGFDADILAADVSEKSLRFAKDACLAAISGNDPTGGLLSFERLPTPTRKDNLYDFANSLDLSKYKVVIGGVGFY